MYLLKMAQLSINFYVMCHIPSTSVLTCCNDLANLIELNITEDRGKLLPIDDFNIHLGQPAHLDNIFFNDTLESLDLQNMVTSPTHRSGHIIDVIIMETISLIHTHRSSVLGP